MLPNDDPSPASFLITGTQGGTANNQTISVTATLQAGQWTSGQLDAFLGISACPTNATGAYLPTTQVLDPGATGYFVYLADIGTAKIWEYANEIKDPASMQSAALVHSSELMSSAFAVRVAPAQS